MELGQLRHIADFEYFALNIPDVEFKGLWGYAVMMESTYSDENLLYLDELKKQYNHLVHLKGNNHWGDNVPNITFSREEIEKRREVQNTKTIEKPKRKRKNSSKKANNSPKLLPDPMSESWIKYYEQVLMTNPNRFQFAINILHSVKRKGNRITNRQKVTIENAGRGMVGV